MRQPSYLPHTDQDRREMLQAMGAESMEELFAVIPRPVRLGRPLALPAGLDEAALLRHLEELGGRNTGASLICFRGGGAYDHYIPSVVPQLAGRSEFLTSYTQYQPELAQGYLQALFEYQSMMCEVTGLDVANASLYDGGTATAEAAFVAVAATGRKRLAVAGQLHPAYRDILETYGRDRGLEIAGEEEGLEGAAALIVPNPDFFGRLTDVAAAAQRIHAAGGLCIVVADPLALGVLEAPGRQGADLVVGEGQPLGLPLSFGGPYLGFLAAKEALLRRLPGRIVGRTTDGEGTAGFVLTLQAREQHIRREKANSNICSNEALCALTAAIHLAALGKEGFREVAASCLRKTAYLRERLLALPGVEAAGEGPHFREFALQLPVPVGAWNERLRRQGILGGLDLGAFDAAWEGKVLLAVTEKRTREEMDCLVESLEGML